MSKAQNGTTETNSTIDYGFIREIGALFEINDNPSITICVEDFEDTSTVQESNQLLKDLVIISGVLNRKYDAGLWCNQAVITNDIDTVSEETSLPEEFMRENLISPEEIEYILESSRKD